MRMALRLAALAALLAATAGFSSQPLSERQAQDRLPQSKDQLWHVLGQCKVKLDAKKYTYSIRYTPEVQALNSTDIRISGFMLPLEPTEKFKHFLLAKRTPTCPFCPPGEPNEIVEVFSAAPLRWEEQLITVKGTLKLVTQGDKGIFFQLQNAVKQ